MRRAPRGYRRSVVALVLATATVPASAAIGEWHLLGWPIALSSGFLTVVIIVCALFLNHLLKKHELTEVEMWRHAGLNDALLDSSAEGVAMCDLDGAIFMANPVFERLTSAIIGKPANLVASPRTMRETGASSPRGSRIRIRCERRSLPQTPPLSASSSCSTRSLRRDGRSGGASGLFGPPPAG